MRVTQVRDYSKRGDALPIPNLIEVQTAAYKRFLQSDVPAGKTQGRRSGSAAARSLPDRVVRREHEARVLALRPGKAALHAGRVPRAAADLRHAVPRARPPVAQGQAGHPRGGDLSRRNPDHDRRRRVHHQRCRARHRLAAPPLAGRGFCHRFAGRRPAAARPPRHPRARKLDRDQRHQEGRAGGAHRPVRQDPGDDVPPGHG